MAHKKGAGSTKNGRDSNAKRLGVKKFGGEYLVRNGEYQVVEGQDNFPRIVIIKFPTYEKALEWYHSDEYKPIKDIRLNNAEGSNIIVKGI